MYLHIAMWKQGSGVWTVTGVTYQYPTLQVYGMEKFTD